MVQKWNGMHMLHVTTSFTFKTGSKVVFPRILKERLKNTTLEKFLSQKDLNGMVNQNAIIAIDS